MVIKLHDRKGKAANMGFSNMLADEYVLNFLFANQLLFRLTEYLSASLHNFNSSISSGFRSG